MSQSRAHDLTGVAKPKLRAHMPELIARNWGVPREHLEAITACLECQGEEFAIDLDRKTPDVDASCLSPLLLAATDRYRSL